MERVPKQVEEILARLEEAGYEAWCVGGAVRDLLLNRTPGDWDVTTNALPEEVMALFAPHAAPTGAAHGTVTVGGGRGVEVTTYRRDGVYLDYRHPAAVEFTPSLTEDLARRDFTVNAIALDRRGTLLDPWNGRQDLADGILRAVGDPFARFHEDALRMMRGLRFAARLGFSIDARTAEAIHRCAPLLEKIAVERLYTEMTGLLCGEHVESILLAYPDVLGVFLPELLPCIGFDQHSRYHCFDVWAHTARAVAGAPANPILRWTMLLHDLGKPDTFSRDDSGAGHFYGHGKKSLQKAEAILARLRFDKRSRQQIALLVERHDCELSLGERAVRRALARYGEETLRLLLAVKRADNLAQAPAYHARQEWLDQWESMLNQEILSEHCFSLRQLAVTGHDLLAIGMTGKTIGNSLNTLLELVIDDKLPNERDILIDYAKEKLL